MTGKSKMKTAIGRLSCEKIVLDNSMLVELVL